MTLDIRSFFIGVATVGAILVVGFGSGVMMGSVISGGAKTPNKLERQAAVEPKLEPTKVEPVQIEPATSQTEKAQSTRSEPQAINEAAKQLHDLKAANPPIVASASAHAAPTSAALAPIESPTAAPAAPAPQDSAAPVVAPTAVQQPALGPQRQVSLPQPSTEVAPLSRREGARLRAQQRREERAQRRALQHQQWIQQQMARRDEQRAARPENADEDEDNREVMQPLYMRPRGLFDGIFGGFR